MALLNRYEAADLEAVSPDLCAVVEAAVWRGVLEARVGRVTRSALVEGRCTDWARGWLEDRWPRVSRSVAVTVSVEGVSVSWLGSRWVGVGRRAAAVGRSFSGLVRIEEAAREASSRVGLRLVRASGSDGSVRSLAAGARRARAVVVRCSAQRGLGLCGSHEVARLVRDRGAGVLVVPDADRLGRAAAPAVMAVLAVAGLGVRLGQPDLEGLWRPGSAHSADDAALDGLCVGPRAALGPGPDLGFGCVLARRPRHHRPSVEVTSGPSWPLAFCAALCSRLLPDRVVLLRAGSRASLRCAGRTLPVCRASFSDLGADPAALARWRRSLSDALSPRHDAAAEAVVAVSSRARG